ncbi:hypothetical protein CALVIDRAFT_548810 [Calocera viscosa TUFC12733]|uniref:Chromate transporter n=1 Tax=Calocera viscosa (strain TUFC12733) TaxID=1330018 RepID=A0A167PF93_CALVF|nr:hypothetical protein CALVIDRAFT_548810 [Calocera viscosa TUFC12733]
MSTLLRGLTETTRRYALLGFTSFGGPNVHFLILHALFITRFHWIDESEFADLLAIGTASPGPASTSMAYSIALLRWGVVCATWAVTLWILPGAVGMFGLAMGVRQIAESLPDVVYRLLTGINAAAVGLIFESAYNLSPKTITDKVTLLITFFSAAVSTIYSSQWLFPVIMVSGGAVTLIWDRLGLSRAWTRMLASFKPRPRQPLPSSTAPETVEMGPIGGSELSAAHGQSARTTGHDVPPEQSQSKDEPEGLSREEPVEAHSNHVPSIKVGILWLALFFSGFITTLLTSALIPDAPLALHLLRTFLLAGTIIFGGGPVVIPLLAEYVVTPGWVSSRDFLLGLAVQQGLPGPNFNFAVYLGALTLGSNPFAGALLAGLGIFLPGLAIRTGILPFWSLLRRRPSIRAVLRGVAPAAVGLIWSALFRLSQIAVVNGDGSQSITQAPYYVVVAAASFVVCEWFKWPPFVGVIAGAVAGVLDWWVGGMPA